MKLARALLMTAGLAPRLTFATSATLGRDNNSTCRKTTVAIMYVLLRQ